MSRGGLEATTDFSRIAQCDAVIICVPTPLDKFKKPDMSYIEQACVDTGRAMKRGTLVSLESTTYPPRRSFMLPILERESGLKAGRDFWLCFSPERWTPATRATGPPTRPRSLAAWNGGAGDRPGPLLHGDREAPPRELPKIAEMSRSSRTPTGSSTSR